MKNKEIVRAILGETEQKDFWLSQKTANTLLKEAEQIEIYGAGIMSIIFEEHVLGVVLKEKLLSDEEISYVQVIYLKDKNDTLYLAEDGTEKCAVL